jgi:lysophospholipase L1-like esterase
MGDNLHPNQDGYEKMGGKWETDMINSSVLPSCP